MEILEKGKPESERPEYTRRCPECSCLFKYHYRETILVGASGGYVGVVCPECGYAVGHIINGGPINHPPIEDV